ncbi:hypothetical protein CTEN210_18050 [Chaetoceros tenuissimus]|uniref:Uncharacterized protein n=1 Tax=Chaetoceros tenuissimus TaxID=426638 RepID=A0AAD3DF94_9STRA|nr:hypothetical protein CTEN210_18050 [Chaetoceros tenuissimus]
MNSKEQRRYNRERSSSHSAYTTCSESTTGFIGGVQVQSFQSKMIVKTQEQSLQCNGLVKRNRRPMISGSINQEDPSRKKKDYSSSSVDFSHATVRLYSMILGDNPACRDGPPITISWHYSKEFIYTIPHDKEDKCQKDIGKLPDDLQLTSEERITILQNQGFTFGEIQRCTLKTNCARAERIETLKRLQQQNILFRVKNFLVPKREKNKLIR